MQSPSSDWLVPDWPAPPTVRALATTRSGGVSTGAYDALNLGFHVGDIPDNVMRNRGILQAGLQSGQGAGPGAGVRPVFLEQVHGSSVQVLRPDSLDGARADAATTTLPGLACTVMVADCLPVLFCDAGGRQVAAAHAGWRGLLGVQGRGVLEATVQSFAQEASAASSLMAWLGPCIGPAAFEVGDEVRQAFVSQSALAASCFVPHSPGKWLADLPALARQRLEAMGLSKIFGNDGSAGWCTVGNPSRFFSHRRDRISGRMAACIWRDA